MEFEPYCCPRRDGKPGCEDPHDDPPRNLPRPERCAFATLLMLGDGYLMGAIMVAMKLRRLAPEYDRVCMVTSDVSARARQLLSTLFTHVTDVPYIDIKPIHVKKSERLAFVYSRTFTKLNVLGLTQYEKVAYLDADTLPMKNVRGLFGYDTPAGVFIGCLRPWSSPDVLRQYKRSGACSVLFAEGRHGPVSEAVHEQLQGTECAIGFETSVMVVKPDVAELSRLIGHLKEKGDVPSPLLKGDSTLLNHMWKGRWHPLDPRYMARWVGDEHDEVWVIDCYGDGKPWAADADETYAEVILWRKHFVTEARGHPELLNAVGSNAAVTPR